MTPISIDNEFRSLIPPLSPDEYRQLEANIKAEGCRDALVVWSGKGILLDGHNRYAICEQHGLPYQTVERAFDSREDAQIWIIQNQFGRRNLTDFTRGELAKRLECVVSGKARQNMVAGGKGYQKSDKPVHTLKELGKIAGVSHDTMHKVETVLEKAPEPIKQAARTGDISTDRAYEITRALEKAPEPIKAQIAERVQAGDFPKTSEVKIVINEQKRAAEIQQRQRETISIVLPEYQLGDCRELARGLAPKSVRLLLTDPPYGMSFQSNRRVSSLQAPKIAGDDSVGAALGLLRETLAAVDHAMLDECHVLIFTGWRYEPEFRKAIETAGYQVAASLIWHKLDHGSGDLGGFAPAHERIIHARRGHLNISPRIDDVLSFRLNQRTAHPTEKPVELLKALIECTTVSGELVLDPFAGTGATVLAARALKRKVCAFEIDNQWYADGVTEITKAA